MREEPAMKINMSNFMTSKFELFDISIVQKESGIFFNRKCSLGEDDNRQFKAADSQQRYTFAWDGYKVLDDDYMCLAKSNIKELDMSICRFKMDELARLIASIPDLKGAITQPYKVGSIVWEDKEETYYYLCKGKRSLKKGKDDEKLEKYLADFACLVEKYRAEK